MKKIRCAIYTRKSAEEGLEQEFNSLDAQREACAAYVASQKAEGWVLLPTVYEDAGVSGGTLERTGLQRLLADIDAGLVDQIVVYKVDRLTRSLSDFAKLVERLEAAGAVFVSVTLCLLFIHPRAPNLISLRSAGTNAGMIWSFVRALVSRGPVLPPSSVATPCLNASVNWPACVGERH